MLVAWGAFIMTVVGFAVGFRLGGTTVAGLAAFGLTIVFGFAFVWLFIFMGLVAGARRRRRGCRSWCSR